MNAALMWLQITASDPRYAPVLDMRACERWLDSARLKGMATANYLVDEDGDLCAWQDATVITWRTWNVQLVMDSKGQVRPCTRKTAAYLQRSADKFKEQAHENR